MNFFHLSLSRSRNLAFIFVNSLLPQPLGQLGKPTALGTPTQHALVAKSHRFLQGKGDAVQEVQSPLGDCQAKPPSQASSARARVQTAHQRKGSACPGEAAPAMQWLQWNHSLSRCCANLFVAYIH